MPAFWALSKVIGFLAKKFGFKGKLGGVDDAAKSAAKTKPFKTKSGRFKAPGTKGPGFLKKSDAIKQIDDVAKTSTDDLLKGAGKIKAFGKVLKKVAVPIGVALDAAEVLTVIGDKKQSKTDVGKSVAEKAAGWGGAAVGAKLGAAGGAAIGSVVPIVGTAVGAAVGTIIGGITGYFASEWAAGEVLDKGAGISSGGEADKGVSKVLEEFGDLDKEQKDELYAAMAGGQSKMNELIDKLEANDRIALTEKIDSCKVFSFGRDHGHFGRILNQTVIVEQSLHIRNGNEISGFCFTPQDGNSILSSIAATEWFLYPHSYEDKIQCLSNLFFNNI